MFEEKKKKKDTTGQDNRWISTVIKYNSAATCGLLLEGFVLTVDAGTFVIKMKKWKKN